MEHSPCVRWDLSFPRSFYGNELDSGCLVARTLGSRIILDGE